MFEKEKKEILDAALEIKKCNLISLSGGNVSMRAGENLFLVTPSGMIYEEMTADDVVVIVPPRSRWRDGGARRPCSCESALTRDAHRLSEGTPGPRYCGADRLCTQRVQPTAHREAM